MICAYFCAPPFADVRRPHLFSQHQLEALEHQFKLLPPLAQRRQLLHAAPRHRPQQAVLALGRVEQWRHLPPMNDCSRVGNYAQTSTDNTKIQSFTRAPPTYIAQQCVVCDQSRPSLWTANHRMRGRVRLFAACILSDSVALRKPVLLTMSFTWTATTELDVYSILLIFWPIKLLSIVILSPSEIFQ